MRRSPSRRTRIFLAVLLIYVVGITWLLWRVVGDIDPRYRESAEEAQVEIAQLMATLIEQDVIAGAIDTRRLEPLFRALYAREFSAQIYDLHKQKVELRVYVTDRSGRVIYDSTGRSVGADYSRWIDVSRTLAGSYGARATRDMEADPLSTVLYVGAPIRWAGEIVGMVGVGKPVQSFGQFVQDARQRVIWVGAGSAAALLVLALIVSVWLVRPFGLTADYIRWLRTQRGVHPLRMLRRAAAMGRAAVQEMGDAFTGRNYVADYVQTFTHEIKSPLSAIRGAAELLQEAGMPPEERERFLANIGRESERIQQLVDRMMELTALETRRVLDQVQPVALGALLREAALGVAPAAARRGIVIDVQGLREDLGEVHADGDPLLLRQALGNLLDNAIDFSPEGGTVRLSLRLQGRRGVIAVRDQGPGIPAYAQAQVFQKFYSLARPHSQKKSTGLGLAFVREIAALHGGSIALGNAEGGGALATLTLPLISGPVR
ncbi:two-component system sensor histidine kinase CreC [Pseudacidovorax sp. RU35E]|uniref:two-component system sensor histidine kinase CreC n=1 Tax=Pseudacidovorax sp. RU35E TaxID=1907403 RepID=UPI000955F611|nr:two-component system sensor histidine kinase CreC [Pseudacidovorax sp. RU35E]SIQ33410.1 two-component system, OmpR family, sensor histidine kinase CreC [Pseudacidovorax sp. RU35E]